MSSLPTKFSVPLLLTKITLQDWCKCFFFFKWEEAGVPPLMVTSFLLQHQGLTTASNLIRSNFNLNSMQLAEGFSTLYKMRNTHVF